MTDTKPFYELNVVEIMNMSPAVLEYQLQEGLPPGLVAHKILELAAWLFTAQSDLRHLVANRAHSAEWWATYRAAIAGISVDLVGRISRADEAVEDVVMAAHAAATKIADKAHGPLEKPATE